jgi:hypothetical protein
MNIEAIIVFQNLIEKICKLKEETGYKRIKLKKEEEELLDDLNVITRT